MSDVTFRSASSALCLISLFFPVLTGCTSREAKLARFIEQGQKDLNRREYRRAILQFANAAQLDPNDADVYYRLGLAYLGAQQLERAIENFRRATNIDPKHTAAQLKMAALMEDASDLNIVREGRKRASMVLAYSPKNADAVDLIGYADLRLGNRDEAVRQLTKLLEQFPARLQTAVTLAKACLNERDFEGAERILKQVAAVQKNANAEFALAQLYLGLRQGDLAEERLNNALALDPRNVGALIALVRVQLAKSENDKAAETSRRLSALGDRRLDHFYPLVLYSIGKRAAALQEFRRLAKMDSDDRDARDRLVSALLASGCAAEAAQLLDSALARNPKDIEALLQKSKLLLMQGKYEEVERNVAEVLHLEWNSAVAHYLIAHVYGARQQSMREREELAIAVNLDASFTAARVDLANVLIASGLADTALKILDEVPEANKTDLAVLIARNEALLALGRVAEARAGIDSVIAAGIPEGRVQQARLKLQLHDFQTSLAEADSLVNAHPELDSAWGVLGAAAAAQRKFPQALTKLSRAAAEHEDNASLQMLLAEWLTGSGDRAGARSVLVRLTAKQPSFVPGSVALAKLEFADRRYDAARVAAERALKADGANVEGLLLLGTSLHQSGQAKHALGVYNKLLQHDPDNALALNNVAALLARKDPGTALQHAERARKLAPEAAAVLDTLATIYYYKGQYEIALEHERSAIERQSTPLREYHLSLIYSKLGNNDLRDRALKSALNKDPQVATRDVSL